MNHIRALPLVALCIAALSMSGCVFSLSQAPAISANIATAAPTVCQDLAVAGALTTAIAEQVKLANPNNAKVQAAANKIIAGIAPAPADCAAIAGVVQIGNAAVQAGAAL